MKHNLSRMAKFLKHEPCEKCKSKDNKAVYSDGSSWCFGCHAYTPPKHREVSIPKTTRSPPDDLMKQLPFLYSQWLDKYNLTPKEKTYFKWSPSLRRMVTTLMNKDIGIFWEGRSLTKTPKTLSFGEKPYVIFLNGDIFSQISTTSLIIVEDIVSALKVSRTVPTFPLFGSHLSDKNKFKLAKNFKEIYIWLDYDKYKEAMDLAKDLTLLGVKAQVICTKEDPKKYDNILDILKERGIITP